MTKEQWNNEKKKKMEKTIRNKKKESAVALEVATNLSVIEGEHT